MLNYDTYGNDANQRILIAHGLYGSGRNWRAIAKRLSADFQVITVDMRNHASSFWDDDMSYSAMAVDLANVIGTIGAPMFVLGHSMGGKAAMILALTRPELIEGLIIADIAPVAYTHTQIPLIDAMERVDLSKVVRRSDADEQLAREIDSAPLRAFLIQSLNVEEGSVSWTFNLKALRASMPQIVGWPSAKGEFIGNSLFLSGADSDYVTLEGKTEIKRLFPAARFATLKNAGHWLHADQPRAFVETVQAFCKR